MSHSKPDFGFGEATCIGSDTCSKLDIEKKGLNWDKENTDTFKDWLKIASFNVQSLEYAIKEYKAIIQYSVIVGLVLSTASGTTSSARIGLNLNSYLDSALNIAFVVMTFSIAIFTGAIKVYQIQERLEEFIKAKQEWLNFITVIGTEFQLPLNLRQNAIDLIIKHKDKYLDLMKRDLEIPDRIKNRVLKENQWRDIDGKNISRTILEIAGEETIKMERRNSECIIIPPPMEKKASWFPKLFHPPSVPAPPVRNPFPPGSSISLGVRLAPAPLQVPAPFQVELPDSPPDTPRPYVDSP